TRQHNTCNILLMLRTCSMIYRKCCRRQPEHHYREFTLHKVTCREVSAIFQLCEEDVQISSYNIARCIRVCTKLKPEWRMENMMQSEWNEQPFNHTEHEHTECRRFFHQEI